MAVNPATGVEDPNYKPSDRATIMPVDPNAGADKKKGLINQATQTPGISGELPLLSQTPTISDTAKSSTVTAEAAQAGPSELVENRVAGIVASDSPLMQLAQTRAAQQAAGRGLVNSSMAVGAAEDAVLSAATPIASADASAINQGNQFNASNTQQANLQNATQAQRTSELNAASENSAIATNTENQMRTSLANLDVASKAFMADFEQKNKQLIQSSANAATLFNTYQQQVAAIMTSPNLDLAGKEKAVANLQTMLQDSLAAQDAISGLDLAGILGIVDAGSGGGTDTGGGGTGGGTGGTGGGTGGTGGGTSLAQWQAQVDSLQSQIDSIDVMEGGSATRGAARRRRDALIAQLEALKANKPN